MFTMGSRSTKQELNGRAEHGGEVSVVGIPDQNKGTQGILAQYGIDIRSHRISLETIANTAPWITP